MRLDIEPIGIREFVAAPIAGGRFRGPKRLKVHVLDLPYDLVLTIEYQGDRYACTSFVATQRKGGSPLSSADLRAVPLADVMQRSLEGLVVPVETTPTPGVVRIGHRRRQPGEDADLAAVIYAVAVVCGKQPMKAVADDLQIPLGTARRLVAQARERGWL